MFCKNLKKRLEALEVAREQIECDHSFIDAIKIKHQTISRVCYKCKKRIERTITPEGRLWSAFHDMALFIETGKEPVRTEIKAVARPQKKKKK